MTPRFSVSSRRVARRILHEVLVVALITTSVRAQSKVAAGVVGSVVAFGSARTEQDVALVVEFQPLEWLSLSAAPAVARTRFDGQTTSGIRDLPISASASYALSSLALSPTLAAGLTESIGTADSASRLGFGRSVTSASAAMSLWPSEWLNVGVSAARPLTTSNSVSWLGVEGSLVFGRVTTNVGMTSQFGSGDAGVPISRSVTGGVAMSLAGPLALTLDATRGLTTGAPAWSVTLGFGTAFSGISPLDPSSALQRVKKVVASKLSSTTGATKGKGKGDTTNCKQAGTC